MSPFILSSSSNLVFSCVSVLSLLIVLSTSFFVFIARNQLFVSEKQWLRRMIPHHSTALTTSTKLIDGTPVSSIIDYAKDNSIIILGVSPKNSIMKYFFGSKPLSIAQKCNCPVLITK